MITLHNFPENWQVESLYLKLKLLVVQQMLKLQKKNPIQYSLF